MSRREIIELDKTPEQPEGLEESAPKRQRTTQKKSAQSQRTVSEEERPKDSTERPRSGMTTLTRSRGPETSGGSGLSGAVVAAAPRSSRPEDAVVAAASRLGHDGDIDASGSEAIGRTGLSGAVVAAASRSLDRRMQSWQLHPGWVAPTTLQTQVDDQGCWVLSWQQHPDPPDKRMQSWQLHLGWVDPKAMETMERSRRNDLGCRMLSW